MSEKKQYAPQLVEKTTKTQSGKTMDMVEPQQIEEISRMMGTIFATAMADFQGLLKPLVASMENGEIGEDEFRQTVLSLLADMTFMNDALANLPLPQAELDALVSELRSHIMQSMNMPGDQIPNPDDRFEQVKAHPILGAQISEIANRIGMDSTDPSSPEYLKGIEDGIAMAMSLGLTHVSAEAKLRKGFTTKPIPARLINAPGVQILLNLASNYSLEDRFKIHPDHMMAEYTRPGNTQSKAVLDCDTLAADYLRTAQEKTDYIWECIRQFKGVSRDESLIVAYVICRLLQSPDGVAKIGFTELLAHEGKTKLDRAGRLKRAKEYDRVFKMFNAWKAEINVPWTDFKTGKVTKARSTSPMFFYQQMVYESGQGILDGMDACPIGFIFVDSTETKVYRDDPALVQAFGTLHQLSQIPSGKPGGDWAKSIGYAGSQAIRNDAKNGGATKRLSRRFLLLQHMPNFLPDEILNGQNPKRAKGYWKDAIQILKDQGVIASCTEPEESTDRKGWKDKWLDEMVEITLADTWAVAPQKVLDRTVDRKVKQTRKQNKPVK